MGHSGGDRRIVCMVHNWWFKVGTWAVARRPCDVRAVAMVIFRASSVTYIRGMCHARGAFGQFCLGCLEREDVCK